MLPNDLNHVGEELQHGRRTYAFEPLYALAGVLHLQAYSTADLNHVGEELQHGRKGLFLYALAGVLHLQVYSNTDLNHVGEELQHGRRTPHLTAKISLFKVVARSLRFTSSQFQTISTDLY